MNEIIFFLQILIIAIFSKGALKLGKSALKAWVAVQAIIANLFVLKQVTLFGFDVTASDAFMIGSLLGLNLLQEYFSREEAKATTWICFFLMFFFAVVSQLHLLYIPNQYDVSQASFSQILSPAPRLLFASMGVFFIVQQIDIYFFSFLKQRLNLDFSLRLAITLIVSQFLDTFLFSVFGLYGIVASVFDIIIVSFGIKLIAIFCITPLLKWSKA